jgi:hypothetical protein
MAVMRAATFAVLLLLTSVASVLGQTPQPFPRPGGSPVQPQGPAPTSSAPAPQRPAQPAQPAPADPVRPAAQQPPAAAPAPAQPVDPAVPSAATLGLPVYPTAQFIASYDAGRGQRYYLFGVTASYAELVTYYRAQLREKGDEVFEQPPTHMFQVGRFRDETMAFPPGVTVKDWTWGGSQGYPNPKLGAQPARYPTVIMIVPAPPAASPAAR